MSTYAIIMAGIVSELVVTDSDMHDLYHPDIQWANVDNVPGIQAGWTAIEVDGVWEFSEYVAPPPTPEEVTAQNKSLLQVKTQIANSQKAALTARVSTLQDAIDLEMATPEETVELPLRQAQLVEWKRYAVYLGRVTLQTGWALTVEWPAQPAQGMDLTVSATLAGKSA